MRKSNNVGRSVLAALSFAVGPFVVAGCGTPADPPPERAETGSLRAPLGSTSAQGVQYRLRTAQFVISGPQAAVIDSELYLSQNDVTQQLVVGGYGIALQGGWSVERLDAATQTWSSVGATLMSPAAHSFVIQANQTTEITYLFRVDGGTVQFGGSLHLVVGFDDSSPEDTMTACTDGIDNDADGLVDCANPPDPGCLPFCGGPAENTAATCADTIDNDGDGTADCADFDCVNGGFCAAPGGPGQLIVTELMVNPLVSIDTNGEWVEIMNPTAAPLDLAGCTITTQSSPTFTIAGSLPVPSGGYVVVGRSADVVVNGGYTPDYVHPPMVLGNATGAVTVACGGQTIDTVTYDNLVFASNGQSIQLSITSLNALLNDDATQWCLATTPFGAGDLGTPGLPNHPCP